MNYETLSDCTSDPNFLLPTRSVSTTQLLGASPRTKLIQARATAVAIGQSILVNSLIQEIPKRTAIVTPQAVISNGALDLQRLAGSSEVLEALRGAYAKAIQNLLLYSLVAVCVALPFALRMEWLNVKKAAVEKREGIAKGSREDGH